MSAFGSGALLAGFGRQNVRVVPSDERFAMDAGANFGDPLEQQCEHAQGDMGLNAPGAPMKHRPHA